MSRARHPKKEVEAALRQLESSGEWRVEVVHSSGHRWGVAKCVFGHSTCQVGIWSTPKSPGNHAKQILSAAKRCPREEA